MAAKVRVMKRPKSEASYLRATLKGMALTFRHMIWRGTHVMEQHEDGRP
jgi:NADH-quinone oxidoreductase subunit I